MAARRCHHCVLEDPTAPALATVFILFVFCFEQVIQAHSSKFKRCHYLSLFSKQTTMQYFYNAALQTFSKKKKFKRHFSHDTFSWYTEKMSPWARLCCSVQHAVPAGVTAFRFLCPSEAHSACSCFPLLFIYTTVYTALLLAFFSSSFIKV